MRKYPQQKIFCVGLNKTGTTSLGDALEAMQYRRFGWDPGPCSKLLLNWYESRFEKFVETALRYDAFEDLPWPLVFKQMDDVFPNAKFILTIRKSSEEWLDSMQVHIERINVRWFGHKLVYGSFDPVADARMYLDVYENHNRAVREHFSGRDGKLLEIVVGSGTEDTSLANFLGIPPIGSFPHANKRPS